MYTYTRDEAVNPQSRARARFRQDAEQQAMGQQRQQWAEANLSPYDRGMKSEMDSQAEQAGKLEARKRRALQFQRDQDYAQAMNPALSTLQQQNTANRDQMLNSNSLYYKNPLNNQTQWTPSSSPADDWLKRQTQSTYGY